MVDPNKPFKQYTDEDWREYDQWAAGEIRKHAAQEDARGRSDLAQKFRASADKHEEWAKKD